LRVGSSELEVVWQSFLVESKEFYMKVNPAVLNLAQFARSSFNRKSRDANDDFSLNPSVIDNRSVERSSPVENRGVETREAAVQSIVNKYNLRNISYTDLEQMSKDLRDAGALQPSEFLDFLPPSPEFAMLDGTANPDWNRPMDYIGMIEDQIEFSKATFPGLSTEYHERQLALKMQFSQS
jgi:hypothetical protein